MGEVDVKRCSTVNTVEPLSSAVLLFLALA